MSSSAAKLGTSTAIQRHRKDCKHVGSADSSAGNTVAMDDIVVRGKRGEAGRVLP